MDYISEKISKGCRLCTQGNTLDFDFNIIVFYLSTFIFYVLMTVKDLWDWFVQLFVSLTLHLLVMYTALLKVWYVQYRLSICILVLNSTSRVY